MINPTSSFVVGQQVKVLESHQKHRGKQGIVEKVTPFFVFFVESTSNNTIKIKHESLSARPASSPTITPRSKSTKFRSADDTPTTPTRHANSNSSERINRKAHPCSPFATPIEKLRPKSILSRRATITPATPAQQAKSTVKFGDNSVAEFRKNAPSNQMERMSIDVAKTLFPNHIEDENEEMSLMDDDDKKTRTNAATLAEWDTYESDGSDSDGSESEDDGKAGYVVVQEEEETNLSPNVTTRQRIKHNSRPVALVERTTCKHCKRCARRTSWFFYE